MTGYHRAQFPQPAPKGQPIMDDMTSVTSEAADPEPGIPRPMPSKLVTTSMVSLVIGPVSIFVGAMFVFAAGLGGDPNPPPPGSWMNDERFTLMALFGPMVAGFVGIVAGVLAGPLPRAAAVLLAVNGLLLAAFSLRFAWPFWLAAAVWWFLASLAWRGADEKARQRRLERVAAARLEAAQNPLVVALPDPGRPSTPPAIADGGGDEFGTQLTAMRRRLDRRAGAH